MCEPALTETMFLKGAKIRIMNLVGVIKFLQSLVSQHDNVFVSQWTAQTSYHTGLKRTMVCNEFTINKITVSADQNLEFFLAEPQC